MSFRIRLTLAAAAAVAVVAALAAPILFFVVRGELRGQVDEALRSRAEVISSLPFGRGPFPPGPGFPLEIPEPLLGGAGGYAQLVTADGDVVGPRTGGVVLPLSEEALAVAASRRDAFLADTHVAGTHVRVLTTPLEPGLALQLARPLDEVDRVLDRLRVILLLVALGGIGIAAGLGYVVARSALAPVRRLTEATEQITETQNLSRRVEAPGEDELSRLAASFNAMLEALEQSLRAQRQLVADASHELRTPLTSLRTNIEVLARPNGVTKEEERKQLLNDVVEQLAEMSTLVADVVELGRGSEPEAEPEDVRLDELVAEAVERARLNAAHVRFTTDLERSVVRGVPARIERAVSNLLDNAAKWSPAGGVVEVTIREGEVSVRDHGPGIDETDLPYVFDRFYRAPTARRMPGSGLGLAIVRDVAESHGGRVAAEAAEGGGTRLRLKLGSASDAGRSESAPAGA